MVNDSDHNRGTLSNVGWKSINIISETDDSPTEEPQRRLEPAQ